MKRSLVLLVGLLTVGCHQAEEGPYLELVPNEERERPPQPLSEALLITWRPAAGTGPLEVTLPLPADGPELTVRSLAVEVDAGSFDVSGDDPRVLRLQADDGAPAIRTRLLLERRQRLTTPPLPAALAALAPSLSPAEWVAESTATEPEVPARVVFGLVFDGPSAVLSTWPEVQLEGKWQAVPLEPPLGPDRLRLGPLEPSATRDGAPTPLTVEVQRLDF